MPAVFRADCGYSEKHLEGTVKAGKITSKLTSCIRKKKDHRHCKNIINYNVKKYIQKLFKQSCNFVSDIVLSFHSFDKSRQQKVWAKCGGIHSIFIMSTS